MATKLVKISMILFISLTILLTGCSSNSLHPNPKDRPQAENGVIDLTDWDFERNGIVALDGQWEFFWKEHLTPKDFKEMDPYARNGFIMVPRAWNKHVLNQEILSGVGYGTYRLTIHNQSDQILGIKIPRIFTSYKLWANGDLLASAGKVGLDREHIVPQYLPQVQYLQADSDTIELVIQVSNFRHRSGGILESIQFGSAADISELRTRNLTLELFLVGSLFIIGFYHIALFLFRTKDKSTLFFGIYSLLICARTMLVGEIYFIHLFPSFSWEIAHKIQTLAYYLGVPLVILFLKSTFPNDISNKVTKWIQVIALSFALLVLFTPVKIFTPFNPIYQVFSLAVILYILFIVILTCYRKREGSYLIGFGIAVLILTAVNDILFLSVWFADSDNHYLRHFVSRGNLSSWGLLIFVFTQSLVLAKKFSKSFSNVEILSEELQQANTSLEEKVKERTFALETSKEKLKAAYQAVTRSEQSLQDLTQNISHDLRTPLSAIKGYVNAILDGIVKEPQQQTKYLKRVIDKVNHLNEMVQELLDLSQLQARQLTLQFTPIPVNSFVKNQAEKYTLDMMNEKVVFNVHTPPELDKSDWGESLFVNVDVKRLERVFVNLLSNAVKYTAPGGHIGLSFSFTDAKDSLLIEVSDTGIGIPQELLSHIFDRFYMVSKSRQGTTKGSGLGLAIAKEIVEYHEGEIWVESTLDEGSRFIFTLPIFMDD